MQDNFNNHRNNCLQIGVILKYKTKGMDSWWKNGKINPILNCGSMN